MEFIKHTTLEDGTVEFLFRHPINGGYLSMSTNMTADGFVETYKAGFNEKEVFINVGFDHPLVQALRAHIFKFFTGFLSVPNR